MIETDTATLGSPGVARGGGGAAHGDALARGRGGEAGEQRLAALFVGEAGVEGLGEGAGLEVHRVHLDTRAEGNGALAGGLGADAGADGGAGGVVAAAGGLGGRLGIDALDGGVREERTEIGALVGVAGGEDEAGHFTHGRIVKGRRGSRNGEHIRGASVDHSCVAHRSWRDAQAGQREWGDGAGETRPAREAGLVRLAPHPLGKPGCAPRPCARPVHERRGAHTSARHLDGDRDRDGSRGHAHATATSPSTPASRGNHHRDCHRGNDAGQGAVLG